MRRFHCIALLCLTSIGAWCQELPLNTRQQLENLSAATGQEPDDALLLQLEAWRRHPLNLNTASAQDLAIFPFLSALQIAQFFRYRNFLGLLTDLHELQAVPDWDLATIRELLPYVTLNPSGITGKSLLQQLSTGDHQVLLRLSRTLQPARGFKVEGEHGFAGDRNQVLARYLYRHGQDLQYGITAEKDAGEPILKKGRATPDFASAHFFWRGKGLIKTLAIGDYTANLGQGLTQWQALAFGKSAEVLTIKRQGAPLRPYSAAGESYFLRGAGIVLGKGAWEAILFAARQKIHANVAFNDLGEKVITSFSPSGLHRTLSEYIDRKSVGQFVGGGSLKYSRSVLQAGINGVYHQFAVPVQKDEAPYNLYAMQGRRFFNLSADYGYTIRNLHLFGEAAVDFLGRPAIVQGALLSAHAAVDLSLLVRHMHKGYSAVAANPFTEASNSTNEQGIYLGLQWRLPSRIRINAYADLFRSPWLRFRVDAPGSGSDYLVQVLYQPSKEMEAYLLFRSEQKPVNSVVPRAGLRTVEGRQRQAIRLQFARALGNGWLVRSRTEMVGVRRDENNLSTGFLCFADAHYRAMGKPGLDLRVAWFETKDFDSRIYAYEQDVLYSYSIPALSGKGLRAYGNLRLQINQQLSAWLRLAHTVYTDRKTMGSGLMTIDGNNRTDLRVQAILSF